MILAWRKLTSAPVGRSAGPGAPTLLACSGGADSTALALCLATAGARITIAHVLHDLRAREEAEADRAFTRTLAAHLGAPFLSAEVRVGPGNREGGARALRYRALAELARGAGMRHVATAHHADDQFESVVMALLRGAGPDGMRGAGAKRAIGGGMVVVRPMLEAATRADCVRLCELAGVAWSEDATNADRSRLRTALRHGALRDFDTLRPGAARRAATSARLMRDAAGLIADRAAEVFGDAQRWERERLRGERAVVVGHGLRRAMRRLSGGGGLDRLPSRRVDEVVRAVRDRCTDPRVFRWPTGVVVRVDARAVSMTIEE